MIYYKHILHVEQTIILLHMQNRVLQVKASVF